MTKRFNLSLKFKALSNDEIGTEAVKHLAWLDTLKKGEIPDYELDWRALPPTAEKRVFIGGSYQFVPVLRNVQRVVAMQGFMPIFLGDFKIDNEDTYEVALTLLNQCKSAIFEVTLDSGHLLEIHEASRKGINMLMLYMASDWKKKPPKGSTSMVHTMKGQKPVGYRTFQEMEKLIIDFLESPSKSADDS